MTHGILMVNRHTSKPIGWHSLCFDDRPARYTPAGAAAAAAYLDRAMGSCVEFRPEPIEGTA